jgi:Reverse transcriptase (RNA-dependent DNA polymerase)
MEELRKWSAHQGGPTATLFRWRRINPSLQSVRAMGWPKPDETGPWGFAMLLKETSLNWALKHVRKEGDTDLFPQPFEFEVIKKYWPTVLKELKGIQINAHAWQGPRRLMVPKSEFGFRAVCQLDPLDSILFAALVREIGNKIERKRSAPSDNTVFSYRFDPGADGRLYAASTGWERFWKISSAHCDEFPCVLVTDISDFYNQIYHHTVENQLNECGIKREYWFGLKNLLANVTEGVSRGVPIGPHPSHLIAEMAMIPVDEFLQSIGVEFCRYVDDIHIFCKSERIARSTLYKFADYLDKTQKIQLNRQKTHMLDTNEFRNTCETNSIDKPINNLELQVLNTVRSHTKSPYERVRIIKLSNADLATLSQANIESVLKEYLDADEVDYIRLRWFIRRLAQVGAPGGVNLIVKRFDEFLPAIAEVGKYFEAAAPNSDGKWKDIGKDLIALYDTDLVQASEYLQVVILSLFSRIKDLNHVNSLTKLYATSSPMCQRKIMLAAATAKASAWLSTLKGAYKNADPWSKRAILYSLRALPKDAKDFWLKSVKKRVHGLDALVVDYISK